MNEPTTIERAFALAESGSCRSVADIRRALVSERFSNVDAHLAGSAIKKQLNAILARAAASRENSAPTDL